MYQLLFFSRYRYVFLSSEDTNRKCEKEKERVRRKATEVSTWVLRSRTAVLKRTITSEKYFIIKDSAGLGRPREVGG